MILSTLFRGRRGRWNATDNIKQFFKLYSSDYIRSIGNFDVALIITVDDLLPDDFIRKDDVPLDMLYYPY
jgi:hypothetical protein